MTATEPLPPHPSPLTLHDPGQLVAALPLLLGHEPTDSLVAIGFGAPPGGDDLTVRADLPADPDDSAGVAAVVAAVARRLAEALVTEVVVVTAAARPQAGDLPHRRLVDQLHRRLVESGVAVLDTLCTDRGRWWCYTCSRAECCPAGGTRVPREAPLALAAAMALAGRSVVGDLGAVAGGLAPVTGPERRALGRAFDRALDRVAHELDTVPRAELVRRWAGEVRAEVERRGDGGRRLSVDGVARLSLVLAHRAVRDLAGRWAGTRLADTAEGLWLDLVRRAEPGCVAVPASLLALHAHTRGDGTFARVAAERAVADDGDCVLAHRVLDALDRGLPPATLLSAVDHVVDGDRPGSAGLAA